MLTILRQSIGSWVAKIFILLLVASFGVWGVSGAIVGGLSGSVISVGGTSVSANDYLLAYERARYSISRQFGRLLTRDELRVFGIEANVVTQLVSGALLDESARSMKLGLSTENLATLISKDTEFQDASGNFDRRVLRQRLNQLGMSETDYVNNRQNVAVRNQLLEGITANTTTPQAYIEAYDEYRNEKRKFEYVTLTPDFLEKTPQPTRDDIQKYYDANKADFVAPEYRKLVIVKLQPEDISNPDAITKQDVADEYEARKSSYIAPEKRTLQQLTLTDEAQGKSILTRMKDGELFESILQELGKTEADISLGEFTKDALPDANVANAVFALEINETSNVVNGIFGPVLLRVTNIVPETIKPIEEVEADIRNNLALIKANDELFDIHDRLEDERAAGDNLTEAAKKVQLTPRIVENVDATGKRPDGSSIADTPEQAKLLREAFETAEGVETNPISISNSGFVWFEVQKITSERQKPLDEVKDEAAKIWVEKETASAVEKLALGLKNKLADGEDFATQFAALIPEGASPELKVKKVEQSAELSREDSSDALTTAAIRAGFAVADNQYALATGNENGHQILLKVDTIVAGEGNSVGPEEKTRLDQAYTEDILNQFVGDLRQRKDVSIDQNAIVAAQNLIR